MPKTDQPAKHFPYTPEGHEAAKQYLKDIGQLEAIGRPSLALGARSLVDTANILWERETKRMGEIHAELTSDLEKAGF